MADESKDGYFEKHFKDPNYWKTTLKDNLDDARQRRGRLHFLGLDAHADPAVGYKCKRGIYASDRIHTLVAGFPGSGKTRFLLSQIKQHIDRNEGFLVLDSHRDLSTLVLSHIPKEKWANVVYINPWTAFEKKYGNRVVQINFLEYENKRERDVVARLFMDTLEKFYERWWGPRLDMILMNALYLLMETENPRLPDLYRVLNDKDYRDETLLPKCEDENIRLFWTQEYEKMPRDASSAVLTKLYKIVQERIIVPLFMAYKSSINFRRAMDMGKFIIVDLPEGRVTTDIANFVGSLIIAQVYMAGMSREDTPEDKRLPFFVYVDEAYRYTTKSIAEILQSLRKYKVFMTLASQYLGQYRKDIQESLPATCETIVSFRVGEKTARTLANFYPPEYGYQTLMNLPRHFFFVSTPYLGNREYQVLETLDPGKGGADPDDVVKQSLMIYGREVNADDLVKQLKEQGKQERFLNWPVTPAEWNILLTVRLAGGEMTRDQLRRTLVCTEEKSSRKLLKDFLHKPDNPPLHVEYPQRSMEHFEPLNTPTQDLQGAKTSKPQDSFDQEQKHFQRYSTGPPPYALSDDVFANALRNLLVDSLKWMTAWLTVKEKTANIWREEYFPQGKVQTRLTEKKTRSYILRLADKTAVQLLDPKFKGAKAGDELHTRAIMLQRNAYWRNHWIVRVDTGETAASVADLYVTPFKPAAGEEGAKGYIDPMYWDYERSFAVEVEMYPEKHWDRVENNFLRNKNMGFPTVFVVPTEEAGIELKRRLEESGAKFVNNVVSFQPDHPEMIFVEVDQTRRTAGLPNQTVNPCDESKERQGPKAPSTTQPKAEEVGEERGKEKSEEQNQTEQLQKHLANQANMETQSYLGKGRGDAAEKNPETTAEKEAKGHPVQGRVDACGTAEKQEQKQKQDPEKGGERGEAQVEEGKQRVAGKEKAEDLEHQKSERSKGEALLALLRDLKDGELTVRERNGKQEVVMLKQIDGRVLVVSLGCGLELQNAMKVFMRKLEKPLAGVTQQSRTHPSLYGQSEGKAETAQSTATTPNGDRAELASANEAESTAESLESTKTGEDETVGCEVEREKTSYRENLVRELVHSGWWFTLRKIKGKEYLTARSGKNEAKSLGAFDDEVKRLIEKFKLQVKGFNC